MSVSQLYRPAANGVCMLGDVGVLMAEMRGEKWWGEGWRRETQSQSRKR